MAELQRLPNEDNDLQAVGSVANKELECGTRQFLEWGPDKEH